MHHFTISALCLVLLAAPSTAQKPKAFDGESSSRKSEGSCVARSKTEPRSGTWPQDTFPQWEWWTNVTIAPNSSVNLDTRFDYSTTDTVRVTIRSTGPDLASFVMGAYWAVPQLPLYALADFFFMATRPEKLVRSRRSMSSSASAAQLAAAIASGPESSPRSRSICQNGPE